MLLKRTTLKNDDVVVIRLSTGEEIVGRYEEGTDFSVVTLKKPRVFHFQQMPNGQISAGMGPAAVTVDPDQTISFVTSSLLFTPVLAKDEIRQNYMKVTSSIEIVSGQSSLIK